MTHDSDRNYRPVVAILICTYKRPDLLNRLLTSLENNGSTTDFACVVVDNDPAGSATATCRNRSIVQTYIIEPNPGISHARNTAIENSLWSDFIIFVDDDEVVAENWVDIMVRAAVSFKAEAVAGPVLSQLPKGCPAWIRDSGLFDRARHATGTEMSEAGSGNLLFSTSVFLKRDKSRWFNADFGLTGGGDAELTRRFVREGLRIVWCDEGWAAEEVPATRASLRWLVRRQMRLASVDYRLQGKKQFKRSQALIKGTVRIFYGSARLLTGYFATRRIAAPYFRMTFRGVGFVTAAFGTRIVEYKR